MKQLILLLCTSLLATCLSAQVPFAVKSVKEKVKPQTKILAERKGLVQRTESKLIDSIINEKSESIRQRLIDSISKLRSDVVSLALVESAGTKTEKDEEEKAEFFTSPAMSLVYSDGASSLFPSLSGNIIRYRLQIASRTISKGKDEDSIKRTYLPLFVITNVAGAIAKNGAETQNNATSYFGSPFTFRINPVKRLAQWGVEKENKLIVGMINDFRAFAVGDTAKQKIDVGFGYYGAVGFTLFGPATITDTNTDSKEYDGKWSFSALYYAFASGGKFNKAVFANAEPPKWLTGFEFLLHVKTNNTNESRLNLFLGAQYDLSKNSPNYQRWNFRMGIGK
jgi:hypothetical protein